MRAYQIQASVTTLEAGYRTTRRPPTFFLHSGVQGIRDAADAASIARRIVDPTLTAEVSLTAYCDETDDYADKRWLARRDNGGAA